MTLTPDPEHATYPTREAAAAAHRADHGIIHPTTQAVIDAHAQAVADGWEGSLTDWLEQIGLTAGLHDLSGVIDTETARTNLDVPSTADLAAVSGANLLSDDETLANESTTKAPTERAAKAYVDQAVDNATSGMPVVEHGGDPLTVRPDAPAVYWIGSVPPANGEAWDLFFDTDTLTLSTVGAQNFVADSFDRADSATTLGSADSGEVWSALRGTWGIVDSQAYLAVPDTTYNLAVVEADAADVLIDASMTFADLTNCGLSLRAADNNNYLYVRIQRPGGSVLLRKYDSGTDSGLATGTIDVPTIGQTSKLQVRLVGADITVSVDGAEVLALSLPAGDQTKYGANTKHGLHSRSTSTRWNSLSIADLS